MPIHRDVAVYPGGVHKKNIYVAPEFANVAPAQPLYDLPAHVVNVLSAAQTISLRQHLKLLPKKICACPPCVKQELSFSVFAGLSHDSQAEFLRIDEVSSDWNRCCCSPYHPLKLEVRPYLPVPGDPNAADFSHFNADVARDWHNLKAGRKAQELRQAYMQQPPLFTIQRDDGQRACCKCPCKVLNTFVCSACCQDGVHVYAGPVQDDPNGELGRPYQPPMDRLLGSVKQPHLGGGLFPVLELRGEKKNDTDVPFGKVEGPYCFAGCSEFCFSYNFWVSKFDGPSKVGDIATITKVRPQTMSGTVSMIGDAQQYRITFNPQVPLTPAEKATIMSSQLLIDYMFFDGNTGMCQIKDNVLYIYLCYSSCCGCLFPWVIPIPLNG